MFDYLQIAVFLSLIAGFALASSLIAVEATPYVIGFSWAGLVLSMINHTPSRLILPKSRLDAVKKILEKSDMIERTTDRWSPERSYFGWSRADGITVVETGDEIEIEGGRYDLHVILDTVVEEEERPY